NEQERVKEGAEREEGTHHGASIVSDVPGCTAHAARRPMSRGRVRACHALPPPAPPSVSHAAPAARIRSPHGCTHDELNDRDVSVHWDFPRSEASHKVPNRGQGTTLEGK